MAKSRAQMAKAGGNSRSDTNFSTAEIVGTDARRMAPTERLLEFASILAEGVIRSRIDQSSGLSADRGDSSLDLPGGQSGYRAHQTGDAR